MATVQLHEGQSQVILDLFGPNPDWTMRFEVVVGSRGFGKSYNGAAAVALATDELCRLPASIPNKNITILCGSHTQVTDIYFPMLAYQFGLEQLARTSSRSTGRFYFDNGTEIICRSADTYERIRGTGQYFVLSDEMPTWPVRGGDQQDLWESVVEPSIMTRWSPPLARLLGAPSPGRALFIASPKGKDYFYELSLREHSDNRWRTRRFDYTASPLLDPDTINRARETMDPVRFAREYLASFEDSSARVFYTFAHDRNVIPRDRFELRDDDVIHVSIDFNVFRNCSAFHVIRNNEIVTFDETEGSADTEELAHLIRSRYPRHRIRCYPDPTGNSRKTSAPTGRTDFTILANAGFEVLARRSSPSIVDSVAAVNRLFLNAKDEVRWRITNNCTGFIKSMDRTQWLESRSDSAVIDKSQDVEHFSDGARYMAEYLFPIGMTTRPAVRGFTF